MIMKANELFVDKSSCCGCGLCALKCPLKAVAMKPDEEGFLYPVIDEEKCVNCKTCIKVCIFKGDC